MSIFISVFILGLVHGLTPCEHTWPILFAFTIGVRKTMKGILAAVILALSATIPWIIIGGLCGYFGLIIWKESYEIYVHLVLGMLMIIFGLYILRFFKMPHLHLGGCCEKKPKKLSLKQLPIYGLILGFGPCVPTLMMYTYAANLHNTILGGVSGLLFGLGTMVSLVIIGGILGKSLQFTEKKTRKDFSKLCTQISAGILIIFGIWSIISIII